MEVRLGTDSLCIAPVKDFFAIVAESSEASASLGS
jgi:hypothetical protein